MNYAVDRLDRRYRFSTAKSNQPNNEKSIGSNTNSSLSRDLYDAHSMLAYTSDSKILRDGHALAGRTLRDGGFCQQSLFHFGMAWIYDAENAMAAGECVCHKKFHVRFDEL